MATKVKTNKFHHNNLHDAIKHADIKEVQRLVQQGCPINGVDSKFKFAPIHWAVHYGSIECLHWLLWHGADFHKQSTEGWTPTHVAAIRGRDLCLQSLAANGADMNILDSRGKTAGHLACSHGNAKALQEILRKGLDQETRDAMGWTPTHTAAFHGRLGCMQILNKWGFDMKSLDSSGNSLAHLSAGEGHLSCLKFLASIATKLVSLVKARNDQGDTPKDVAIQFSKKKCVEYLESVEYDVEHPECSENLAYPAHNSAYNGDLEFLQMAIETGVASINDRDERGSTPSHKAAGNGQLEVLKWLIERGANMSILNSAGENARDIALRFGKLDCAKLIGGGSDFEDEYAEDEGDVTPDGPQSKAEAKSRAEQKCEELREQLEIAKLNFQHLGGVLPEDNRKIKEQHDHARITRDLESQLEYERVKREKLESQLDATRLQIHNLNRELEDARHHVIMPKPPSEKMTPIPEPIIKGNAVIPKGKKKKRRTRPKSGVFLVQRTPGVYEPLSLSSRTGLFNRQCNSATELSSAKTSVGKEDSAVSMRPKTAFAEYRKPGHTNKDEYIRADDEVSVASQRTASTISRAISPPSIASSRDSREEIRRDESDRDNSSQGKRSNSSSSGTSGQSD